MYSTGSFGGIERKLNRHATTILIGGLFLTFSGLMYMAMCNMPCEDRTYGIIKEDLAHAKSKAFWKKHFLTPSREISAFLVVLVMTGPENGRQRDAIRETWWTDLPDKVFARFLIGTDSLSVEMMKSLERENMLHKDVLFLKDHQESYRTLSSKLLEGFKWVDRHVDYKFLMKVDDDSYARLDVITKELKTKPEERFYWGFFDGRAHVKKGGKWTEKDWILCDRYLPYALGGGYLLSSDLVHFVSSNSHYLKTFLSEDVSLGTWLAGLDIRRIHDPRFNTEYRSRGCKNVYIVTHKQSIVQIRDLHQSVKNTGHLCRRENRLRNSYIYNWNVPPTLCCIRNDSSVP